MDIDLIMKNRVTEGETYPSYAALCKYIDIPCTTGKQRTYDQEHLRCYFSWEKVARRNSITITKTYYENPINFEDGRKNGIRTTPLGEMTQQLIINYAQDGKAYSKTGLLYALGIEISFEGSHKDKIDTHIKNRYGMKICDLMDGALHQLELKQIIHVEYIVVYGEKKQLLDRKQWDLFHTIKRDILTEFNAQNEYIIYHKGKRIEYRQRLNEETEKQIGLKDMKDCLVITFKKECEKREVSSEEFFHLISENLLNNYRKRNHVDGGFGRKPHWETMKKRVSALVGSAKFFM